MTNDDAVAAPVIACPGSGAGVPDAEGPVHPYVVSAPGCWSRDGTLVAELQAEPSTARTRGLATDAYGVQHPTSPDRRNRQSVAVHLVSLHLILDHHAQATDVPRLRARLIEKHRARGFPWLEPPADRGAVTVADVAATPLPLALVRRDATVRYDVRTASVFA